MLRGVSYGCGLGEALRAGLLALLMVWDEDEGVGGSGCGMAGWLSGYQRCPLFFP